MIYLKLQNSDYDRKKYVEKYLVINLYNLFYDILITLICF